MKEWMEELRVNRPWGEDDLNPWTQTTESLEYIFSTGKKCLRDQSYSCNIAELWNHNPVLITPATKRITST